MRCCDCGRGRRSGRLSATGFWATNHPDPAFDRELVQRDLREQFVLTLSHDMRNPLTAARA